MTDLMIYLFFAMGIATAIAVAFRTQLVYEYPYLMTLTFTGVFGPQVLALWNDYSFLPPNSFERVMILMNLCILGCWVGYSIPVKGRVLTWFSRPLSANRLQWGGLALAVISSIFSAIVSMFGADNVETNELGNTTGIFTVLLFFTFLFSPALAISSNLFFRGIRYIPSIGIALSVWFPILVALRSGRRETTVLLVMIILTSLYFVRKFRIPWWLLLPGFLFVSVMIHIIGEYRSWVIQEGIGAVFDFDISENFANSRKQGRAPEICMACLQTDYAYQLGTVNFGKMYYNTMVHRYVPAQFLGKDFKDGLMMSVPPILFQRNIDHPIYAPPGTTTTGMGDSYAEFGYLGWLVFALFGYATKIVWKQCIQGNIPAQVFYAGSITSLMRGATHQTVDVLPGVAFVALAVGSVYFFARAKVNTP